MRLLPVMTKVSKIAVLRYEQDHASQLKHAKSPKTRAGYYGGLVETYRRNCPLAPVEEPDVSTVWYTKRRKDQGKQYKMVYNAPVVGFTPSGSIIIPSRGYNPTPADVATLPLSRILAVEVKPI